MSAEGIAALADLPMRGPVLWVSDTRDRTISHKSPAASALLAQDANSPALRTQSDEFHWQENYAVVKSGRERSQLEWTKYSGSWHKLASTKFPIGGTLVLNSVVDVTHLDPRAIWLSRVNLQTQRVALENGSSISFAEVMVLSGLVQGQPYKALAAALKVSHKTVEYRISRLKCAMEVETTTGMMMEIASSGMIYLAFLPIDARHPPSTETELYKKVIG